MSKEFIPLYESIKDNLKDKKAQDAFLKSLETIFFENQEILASSGLYSRPLLTNQPIYDLTGGSHNEYVRAMTLSSDMKPVAKSFKNESFYLRMILATKYYLEVKDEKMLNAVLSYSVLKLYSLLYLTYFTHGSAKVKVMDYTINNLSNKFDIKRLGSLYKALIKLSETNLENYRERLLNDEDNDMFEYMEGFRTRVNSFIKNIYDVFKYNYTHNLYLKIDKTSAINSENEEFDLERDTRSSVISRFTQNFRLWFTSAPVNKKGIRLALEMESLISESVLINLVQEVKEDRSDALELVISGMLGGILEKLKKSDLSLICSESFTAFALSTFNKINISDSNIINIREGLTYYVKLVYGEDVKESVTLRYRKALLLYLIVTIQDFQCR